MTTATNCPLPHRHDPDRPRRPSHGRICTGCYKRLEQQLAELPGLNEDLAIALIRSRQTTEISGQPDYVPIQLDVAEHRDQLRHNLAWWSVRLADEQRLIRPTNPHIQATSAFLLTHLDHIANQPWIEDFAATLTELHRRAFTLAFPDGRRTIHLTDCPADQCTGTLIATVRATDDLPPSVIRCNTCHAEWAADRWLALGRLIHRQEAS